MTYQLLHGDCVNTLASLPAESVDAVVTSPPYAMQRKSTYGGIPEADYPDWTVAWMREIWRVLKPNGSVIINIRPHIKNGQISDYTLRTRLALRDAGWTECEELIWIKRSSPPMGSASRPRRAWESLHWFSKHGRPWVDAKAAGGPMSQYALDRPSNIWTTSRAAKNGWGHASGKGGTFGAVARCRDFVEVNIGRPDKRAGQNVNHPAVYPWQLAEWCGKLVCPPGGTILDPFMGSASTGVAALRNGWHFIGIDAVEEYVDMSRRRLEAEQSRTAPDLFDADKEAA